MANVKSYAAYAASTRLPVLMDGDTFIEILALKTYDPEMFENVMRTNVRYYVPRFSFESAMAKLNPSQHKLLQNTLDELSRKHYDIFNPENDVPVKDEECRFASAAMEFRKKMPLMTMQVSSVRIWELYRIASIQVKLDSDLL